MKKINGFNAPEVKAFRTRYFTYMLIPEGDEDNYWVHSIPFIHDLEWELNQSQFKNDAKVRRDLMKKGETSFVAKHPKGNVTHRIIIEDTPRKRIGFPGEDDYQTTNLDTKHG